MSTSWAGGEGGGGGGVVSCDLECNHEFLDFEETYTALQKLNKKTKQNKTKQNKNQNKTKKNKQKKPTTTRLSKYVKLYLTVLWIGTVALLYNCLCSDRATHVLSMKDNSNCVADEFCIGFVLQALQKATNPTFC